MTEGQLAALMITMRALLAHCHHQNQAGVNRLSRTSIKTAHRGGFFANKWRGSGSSPPSSNPGLTPAEMKKAYINISLCFYGAGDKIRTRDRLITNQQ